MRSATILQLLEAYSSGNSEAFRRAACQLAASEKKAGHHRIAEQMQHLIDDLQSPPNPPFSLPKSEHGSFPVESDFFWGGYCEQRLRDIVMSPDMANRFQRILRENRQKSTLEMWGVKPCRRLLFYGKPGCGKTLAARVLAGELNLPLYTLKLDAIFSKFLGSTANHLRTVFDHVASHPAIYLFDEFDGIGKFRGDSNDIGEARRIVTSFLQMMDSDCSDSIIIAATNFDEVLDRAIYRRFDDALHFEAPRRDEIESLIELRLALFNVPKHLIRRVAEGAVDLSFAEVARACEYAVKSMILDGRRELVPDDITNAFMDAKARGDKTRKSS